MICHHSLSCCRLNGGLSELYLQTVLRSIDQIAVWDK